MSCAEHHCRDCGHDWYDNRIGGCCPECKSNDVQHLYDESGLFTVKGDV